MSASASSYGNYRVIPNGTASVVNFTNLPPAPQDFGKKIKLTKNGKPITDPVDLAIEKAIQEIKQ